MRILILGHSFTNGSGGITMRNLFSHWPKSQLFCASPDDKTSAYYFASYYHMGINELFSRFPFCLFHKENQKSKIIDNAAKPIGAEISINHKYSDSSIYIRYIRPILIKIKIYKYRIRLSLSDQMKDWIADVKPDVIYALLGSLEDCRLFNQVVDSFPNSKTVVHFYDDWISSAPHEVLFGASYKRQIDETLKKVFDKVTVCLTISKYMSEEYQRRYNRVFEDFCNPVEINLYDQVERLNTPRAEKIITYLGRVDKDNIDSINDVIDAILSLNSAGNKYRLNIYTNANSNALFIKKHLRFDNGISVFPFVPYDQVPNLLINQSDILLLPSSFEPDSVRYVKYSVSTKLSEYLAAKKPLLVYAPSDLAISRLCIEFNCAYVVTVRNRTRLMDAILALSTDSNETEEHIANGYNYASAHSREYVCDRFDAFLQ